LIALSSFFNDVEQDGIILTEAQVIAMERKQEKRETFGEIET